MSDVARTAENICSLRVFRILTQNRLDGSLIRVCMNCALLSRRDLRRRISLRSIGDTSFGPAASDNDRLRRATESIADHHLVLEPPIGRLYPGGQCPIIR